MEVRLNKYISDSGYCSRREADRYIEHGAVRINGIKAEVGTKVFPGDTVKVNGTPIESTNETVYIALNKPAGIVCTTDPTEQNNIVDYVNYPTRIFNIGRLDKPSEGLILLTNDGDIVNKILRASNNHEKEYEVVVDKAITEDFIRRMSSGVPILGTTTKRCKITQEGSNRFKIILTQGLNRQIRRMCEYFGYEVTKLKRLRIMNIELGKMPLGRWRFLTENEISVLNLSLKESKSEAKSTPTKSAPAKTTHNNTQKSAQKGTQKFSPKNSSKPRTTKPYSSKGQGSRSQGRTKGRR